MVVLLMSTILLVLLALIVLLILMVMLILSVLLALVFDIFDHACCVYFASSKSMMVSVIAIIAVADYGGSADFADCVVQNR